MRILIIVYIILVIPCVHNSTFFLVLHYHTFQAVCTARHAAVIVVKIIILISIVEKGEVVLNHHKEGLLITTAEAQEDIDCPCNLRGTHRACGHSTTCMYYSIAAASG